jgi:hypothetical protein
MRRQPGHPRLALLVAILSAAAALLSGAEHLGKPMSWVYVIGIFAGGLASGAAIAKAKSDWSIAHESASAARLIPVAEDEGPR